MIAPDAERFDRLAPTYDQAVPFFAETGRSLVEWVGIAPGLRVLDLGSGRGAVSIALAEAVGMDVEIVAGDVSEQMLSRLHALRLPRVDVKYIDATAIDEPDGSFDLVFCAFLLHFLAGRAQALAEVARVLRASGALAMSVPGPGMREGWWAQYNSIVDEFRSGPTCPYPLSSRAARGTNWLPRPAFGSCKERRCPLLYGSSARGSTGSGSWRIHTAASTTPSMKRPGITSAKPSYDRSRRTTRQLGPTSWPTPTSTGWPRTRPKRRLLPASSLMPATDKLCGDCACALRLLAIVGLLRDKDFPKQSRDPTFVHKVSSTVEQNCCPDPRISALQVRTRHSHSGRPMSEPVWPTTSPTWAPAPLS